MGTEFNGRVAVITGAGNGLGRAYAMSLASEGALVVVNDIGATLENGALRYSADATVAEITAAGGSAVSSLDSVPHPRVRAILF